MTHGYILITPSKSKPKVATPARKPHKTRKTRRKSGDIIEIIETTRAPCDGRTSSRLAAVTGDQPLGAIARLETASNQETAAAIDYGDTLKSCSTVDEVRKWFLCQQTSFKDKVARGFNWRRISDQTRATAEAILNGEGSVPAFMLANDHLALEAFEKLRNHLAGYVSADPANEVALVTFITAEGGTSMDRPVIEVRESRKLVNDTMRKMAPHWFGLIDLAFFWTIPHPDGGLHLLDVKFASRARGHFDVTIIGKCAYTSHNVSHKLGSGPKRS